MHIKVDEDLPTAIARRLREEGYECSTVVEQGLGGTKDPQLWQKVQEHGQFLLTADKGFGDLRTHPPGHHHGVLPLRPSQDGIAPLIELMDEILAIPGHLDALDGTVAVASPRGLRVRRGDR